MRLRAILLTHHHSDHVDGVAELAAATGAEIFGAARPALQWGGTVLADGVHLSLAPLSLDLRTLAVPGHTRDHIAYYGSGLLFCGDTLFAGGCGRLFEGSAADMFNSLSALASLPHETLVCCAHEYTLANLRFARQIEPGNAALATRMQLEQEKRARGLPTLPSNIGLELATNPFLRCHEPTVAAAASRECGQTLVEPIAVFAALRAWKDRFRG